MADKQRSPNYPGFGLPEAILKSRQFYDHDGKAAVPREVAVQAWGYQGINGASLRALGALRQFGLMEAPNAGSVRLSADALVLILEPEGSTEYRAAVSSVAMRPAVFRTLAKQYPDGLPSDAAVVSFLVRNANFSEDAARAVIASYRDTLTIAHPAANGDIAVQDANEVGSVERGEVAPRQRLPNQGGSMPALGNEQAQPYDLTLALIGGVQATVRIPRQMSEENYNLLVSLIQANLTAMKPALIATPATADLGTKA